ncbi:proline-rich protein 36-like [Melanotaenia boesemani]|uniref:proline-rich protein 36-like n=1 Tax=Melanotaenia boesemani TaxID=1250792 RepID=UPI001C0496D1|nr:proline-rich protein 36-like [Melanotaenia boesemani]
MDTSPPLSPPPSSPPSSSLPRVLPRPVPLHPSLCPPFLYPSFPASLFSFTSFLPPPPSAPPLLFYPSLLPPPPPGLPAVLGPAYPALIFLPAAHLTSPVSALPWFWLLHGQFLVPFGSQMPVFDARPAAATLNPAAPRRGSVMMMTTSCHVPKSHARPEANDASEWPS